MRIVCLTTIAAADVVAILLAANLRPVSAFWVTGPDIPGPPVQFTLLVTPPADVIGQIATIPDTTIEHA